MNKGLAELVCARRVIVCCGAGGVGKTSVAAALALKAALIGRRVLVVTIDPSRRLAETLGVERNPPAPVSLPPAVLLAAGVKSPGCVDAWMLDPQIISDNVVRRFAADEKEAK